MGRPHRVEVPDRPRHIRIRAVAHRLLIRRPHDGRTVVAIVLEVVEEFGWVLLSFCVMGNHLHLVVRTPDGNLSAGMHQLGHRLAKWANRRDGVTGHLLRERFRDTVITSTAQLVATIRYVNRNAVKHGFCAHADDWEWSSHHALAGRRPAHRALAVGEALALVGGRAAYRALIERDDETLAHRLVERHGLETALAIAIDELGIPGPALQRLLGLPRSTFYDALGRGRTRRTQVTGT